MIDQENMYGWRTVVVCDPFFLKEVPDLAWVQFAQADVCCSHCCHCPGEAPAIAMKHGQCPQIDAVTVHARLNDLSQRVEIGSTMRVHYSFGITRRARC